MAQELAAQVWNESWLICKLFEAYRNIQMLISKRNQGESWFSQNKRF